MPRWHELASAAEKNLGLNEHPVLAKPTNVIDLTHDDANHTPLPAYLIPKVEPEATSTALPALQPDPAALAKFHPHELQLDAPASNALPPANQTDSLHTDPTVHHSNRQLSAPTRLSDYELYTTVAEDIDSSHPYCDA